MDNINNYDLYLSKLSLNNKQTNEKELVNIKDDVILYKKEIKNRINKILNKYLDLSDNLIMDNVSINKVKKHEKHFYYFLVNVIDDIKFAHIKKNVQNDLSNIEILEDSSIVDISNHIFKVDMSICKKPKKQNNVLDTLVRRNKESNDYEKILPKKIMGKKDKKI